MTTSFQIDSRTVFRVVVIALLAVAVAALAREVVSDVRETLRWLAAAIFLALALAPAVALVQRVSVRGHHPPRWLAILGVFVVVLRRARLPRPQRDPADGHEVEEVGSKGPAYVKDLEDWCATAAPSRTSTPSTT